MGITTASPCRAAPIFTRWDQLASLHDKANDDDLVELLQSQDGRALEFAYDRYSSLAFTLAYRMLGDRQMAEDVVQDAFLSLWRNAARYDPRLSSLRSWLVTIVRRRCIDKLRSRSSEPALALEAEVADRPGDSDVWREVTQRVTAETVRVALGQLPSEQRETIELAYFGGLTQSEISQRMRVPLGTVKGRIRMSLHKLQTLLADQARDVQS